MKTSFAPVPDIKSVAVVYQDDVEPFLDKNKMLQTMEQDRKSDLRHYASIPNLIMMKWLNEEFERGNRVRYLSSEWWELVDKKLQDPEWAYLRVDGPSHFVGWR